MIQTDLSLNITHEIVMPEFTHACQELLFSNILDDPSRNFSKLELLGLFSLVADNANDYDNNWYVKLEVSTYINEIVNKNKLDARSLSISVFKSVVILPNIISRTTKRALVSAHQLQLLIEMLFTLCKRRDTNAECALYSRFNNACWSFDMTCSEFNELKSFIDSEVKLERSDAIKEYIESRPFGIRHILKNSEIMENLESILSAVSYTYHEE